MNTANLKIFSASGKLPTYSTEGSAGFDIETIETIEWDFIKEGEGSFWMTTIKTGLKTIFDKNYVLKIYPRSGLGFKLHTELANTVGIIDSDYRGEIIVRLRIPAEFDKRELPTEAGTKIVQGILEYIPTVEMEQLTEEEFDNYCKFEKNERGENGFGSTERREKEK